MTFVEVLDKAEKIVSYAALISSVGVGTAGLALIFGDCIIEGAQKYYNKLKQIFSYKKEGKNLIKENPYKL